MVPIFVLRFWYILVAFNVAPENTIIAVSVATTSFKYCYKAKHVAYQIKGLDICNTNISYNIYIYIYWFLLSTGIYANFPGNNNHNGAYIQMQMFLFKSQSIREMYRLCFMVCLVVHIKYICSMVYT